MKNEIIDTFIKSNKELMDFIGWLSIELGENKWKSLCYKYINYKVIK